MPNWTQTMQEIQGTVAENPLDVVRRKYLLTMHKYTGRNVIAYYSAFLQKPSANVSIDDNDKNGFMQAIHGLDKSKGLDLLLHTPGGEAAATESIVTYLKSVFGNDIRVFVPQMAMSAGTMIALAAREIVMGKQSNLGPIDPQLGGMSCMGSSRTTWGAQWSFKRSKSSGRSGRGGLRTEWAKTQLPLHNFSGSFKLKGYLSLADPEEVE